MKGNPPGETFRVVAARELAAALFGGWMFVPPSGSVWALGRFRASGGTDSQAGEPWSLAVLWLVAER
eukprot:14204213-Heterocapsa_arctica.AAC.1